MKFKVGDKVTVSFPEYGCECGCIRTGPYDGVVVGPGWDSRTTKVRNDLTGDQFYEFDTHIYRRLEDVKIMSVGLSLFGAPGTSVKEDDSAEG